MAPTWRILSFSFPALILAGTLTFLSPCVLPLVPIYLATLAGASATSLREGPRGKGLFAATVAFALGLPAAAKLPCRRVIEEVTAI